MTLKELRELIELFTARESLEELEVEKAGVRLRIKRAGAHAAPVSTVQVPHATAHQPVSAGPTPAPVSAESDDLFYITSPMVGTFYRSAAPTSGPYVSVGDIVEKGTVLCIIEAMKLMNEIESDADGVVTRVFPQNGQPIEYGEKLFAIKTG